ncbi:Pentatricopeptide repeat [Quillaja saponaria]|uniref:Pentatricopeptide repeat n=1 Tax=Quillaja saponaria TaxID=32244 RepID=A0AAD7L9Y5_QUISA|nr:Pentatricopeptide repeat [Quillaja saponaria]
MTTVTTADKFFNHLEKDSGNIENSLSRVSAKLDSKCVSEVLSRCYPKRSHMGLRFFIWAGLQSSYRHSAYMYGRACKLLDIRKNPQMVFNVIEAYRVEGSFVTVNTFKVVLKLCKEAQLADVALWALRKIPEFSLQADTTVYNLVIRLFSEKGDTDMAENLMKEMGLSDLYPDIITYITMIEGFCNVGRLEDAYMLIGVMRGNGCFPNTVVYSALLGGFCRIWKYGEGI